MVKTAMAAAEFGVEFHHVQMYVESLASLATYKKVEELLNGLANKGSFDPFSGGMRFLEPGNALPERIEQGRREFGALCRASEGAVEELEPAAFSPPGQDVVEQLLVGLGWRVTAEYTGAETRSVLVTSQDARGVKVVVTARAPGLGEDGGAGSEAMYDHFRAQHVDRFFGAHSGHQGIAVLAFELPDESALEAVRARYEAEHPSLFLGVNRYEDRRTVNGGGEVVLGSMTVLEALAYYKGGKGSEPDQGTVLRFVFRTGTYGSKAGFGNPQGVLPGLEDVEAKFDGTSIPAYSDHWVSNVVDRLSFLQTLEDVLGFTPKVDFNAGVVAAGRAQIESTVTGNDAGKLKVACDSKEILRDQSQVYLPINNALTEVGHVHGFLKQLGQGVQHLASRVEDLVRFIERVNNYRKITGRGFSFLNIPASYYGRLDAARDLTFLADDAAREQVMAALQAANVCSVAGIVPVDVSDDALRAALGFLEPEELRARVVATVKHARYSNLYKLLSDHFSEDVYLQIVRNKILVDIQAGDVLFQIFTCNILQRKADDEAPFLEFIQRVCSEKKLPDGTCAPIKPGCGGFGIRNFLTLFLSIEVSKAMQEVEHAVAAGDAAAADVARRRVDLFTRQLDESNPILTAISDAMTAEGEALDELSRIRGAGDMETKDKDADRVRALESLVERNAELKRENNHRLQALSEHYSKLMEALE